MLQVGQETAEAGRPRLIADHVHLVVSLTGHTSCRLLHNSSVKVFQHPLKKLQFLTGRKGRSELTLIGGAWDPVDGANPAHSPSTLIATASRAFKAATGVDLSTAVHW